jgi:hypothetical protein
MRKYWVNFKIVGKGGVGDGTMAIDRELPISHERDLAEIAMEIVKTLGEQMPPDSKVQVTHWQRFEDSGIVLPNIHVKTR